MAPGLANRLRVYAMAAQFARRRLAQGIVRNQSDHARTVAHPGQRNGDVGFRPAGMHFQAGGLQQQLACRRTQAQQQLSETDHVSPHVNAPMTK
jgi:hypothetical protein